MHAPGPALLGLPFDAASSFLRGAAEAPPLIREALRSPAGNLWTEAGFDLGEDGALHDAGNLELRGDPAEVRAAIGAGVEELMRHGWSPLLLGGDHSVTYPAVRAFHGRYPRLTLLHFDAHADLYEEYEGDRYSHACPFARILEEGLVGRLIQVGVRTLTGHQREQVERYGVEVVEMRHWEGPPRFRIDTPVYLSLDLDALDPAFAPGVSHREPGGLTVRQLLDTLQRLDAPLVGADVVEFNPRRDPLGITAPVAAKLVKELAAKMLAGSR